MQTNVDGTSAEESPAFVVSVPSGLLLAANDAFYKHSGWTEQELIGKPLSVLQPATVPSSLIAALQAQQAGSGFSVHEVPLKLASGQEERATIRASPLYDIANGGVQGFSLLLIGYSAIRAGETVPGPYESPTIPAASVEGLRNVAPSVLRLLQICGDEVMTAAGMNAGMGANAALEGKAAAPSEPQVANLSERASNGTEVARGGGGRGDGSDDEDDESWGKYGQIPPPLPVNEASARSAWSVLCASVLQKSMFSNVLITRQCHPDDQPTSADLQRPPPKAPGHYIWHASKGLEQLLGHPAESLIGHDVSVLYTPPDAQQGRNEKESKESKESESSGGMLASLADAMTVDDPPSTPSTHSEVMRSRSHHAQQSEQQAAADNMNTTDAASSHFGGPPRAISSRPPHAPGSPCRDDDCRAGAPALAPPASSSSSSSAAIAARQGISTSASRQKELFEAVSAQRNCLIEVVLPTVNNGGAPCFCLAYVLPLQCTGPRSSSVAVAFLDVHNSLPYMQRHMEARGFADCDLYTFVKFSLLNCLVTDPSVRTADPMARNPIVFASAGFGLMCGCAPSEVIHRNCRFLQSPSFVSSMGRGGTDPIFPQPEAVQHMSAALDARSESLTYLHNFRKDGTPFANLLFMAPILNRKDDGVLFWIGVQHPLGEMPNAQGYSSALGQHVNTRPAVAGEAESNLHAQLRTCQQELHSVQLQELYGEYTAMSQRTSLIIQAADGAVTSICRLCEHHVLADQMTAHTQYCKVVMQCKNLAMCSDTT